MTRATLINPSEVREGLEDVGSDAFRRVVGPEAERFPHDPALYEVIRDD
jgi:hypothetical protein